MIEWLKQQYNDLLFKMFPLMPSYVAKECYEEFDEKYKEFRIMSEKRLDFSILSLKKDKYDDLTVESARDVLDELVKQGYGAFELLIGYDGNLAYTGFTDNVFVIKKDRKVLVKE
jgi:hypothetical protein